LRPGNEQFCRQYGSIRLRPALAHNSARDRKTIWQHCIIDASHGWNTRWSTPDVDTTHKCGRHGRLCAGGPATSGRFVPGYCQTKKVSIIIARGDLCYGAHAQSESYARQLLVTALSVSQYPGLRQPQRNAQARRLRYQRAQGPAPGGTGSLPRMRIGVSPVCVCSQCLLRQPPLPTQPACGLPLGPLGHFFEARSMPSSIPSAPSAIV
jgi:hypothetical protein